MQRRAEVCSFAIVPYCLERQCMHVLLIAVYHAFVKEMCLQKFAAEVTVMDTENTGNSIQLNKRTSVIGYCL